MEIFGEIAVGKSCVIVAGTGSDRPVNPARTPYNSAVSVIDSADIDWSYWGSNNLFPAELGDDIENCGVLRAGLTAKARISTGKGMLPFLLKNVTSDGKEELEFVNDAEILDFLEGSGIFEFAYDLSYDVQAYGWSCGSYMLNAGQNKITRVLRRDVFEARLSKKNADNKIEYLFLSADWGSVSSEKKPDLKLPLLEEGNEYEDLIQRLKDGAKDLDFAFSNRNLRDGRHYYPLPLYYSGRAWIKIARSVPACLNAMYKNQISIKYRVTIHPKFWEDKYGQTTWVKYTVEEKRKYQEEYFNKIDLWLTGEDASYKSIFTGGYMDPVKGEFVPYLDIVPLDDKLESGKHLPESGAANSEILFALMINPALMGAGNPGGRAYGDTSGGSNVRESFLLQLMIMEAERRLNASVFNVVKKFNGWDKRIQGENGENGRLVFRYPSGLLTTLDTGKSTKPENL